MKPLNRLHNVTIYTARSYPVATIWTDYRSDRIKFQPIEISRVTRARCARLTAARRYYSRKKIYTHTYMYVSCRSNAICVIANCSDTHDFREKKKKKRYRIYCKRDSPTPNVQMSGSIVFRIYRRRNGEYNTMMFVRNFPQGARSLKPRNNSAGT